MINIWKKNKCSKNLCNLGLDKDFLKYPELTRQGTVLGLPGMQKLVSGVLETQWTVYINSEIYFYANIVALKII